MSTIKVLRMKYDIILGQDTSIVEIPVSVTEIVRPTDKTETEKQTHVSQPTLGKRLIRPNDTQKTSKKAKKPKTRLIGPRETYIACKRQTSKKRMRPMTRVQKHDINMALRSWVATEKNLFGESVDIKLPTIKSPIQYGSKKTNSRKNIQYIRTRTRDAQRNGKRQTQDVKMTAIEAGVIIDSITTLIFNSKGRNK